MIGAILAGGYGKRLKPLTDDLPKGLVELKEKYSILDRQIMDFESSGISEIFFLTGYLGEKIEERFGSGKGHLKFHYLKEDKPAGTLNSLRGLFNEKSSDDILLRNGDTVTDLNFKRFISFARKSDFLISMFITKMRSPYGVIEAIGDMVTSFREKPLLDSYINAGVYYIKKNARSYFFEDYIFNDLEKTVFPKLAEEKLLGCYREDTLWMGIDSEKDLQAIRSEYRGRTDYEWGYVKKILEFDNVNFIDYYIKAGERVELEMERSTARIMSGSVSVRRSDGTTLTLSEGDVASLHRSDLLSALTNTTIELFSI